MFGSEGVAQADHERMDEINREIGLSELLGSVPVHESAEMEKAEKI